MRSIVGLVLAVFSGAASAQDLRPKSSDVGAAIDRGLVFLAKDAMAWKKEHNAHRATMVAKSGDGRTGVPRPAGIPKALNAKAVWFALALGADPKPDAASQEGLKLLLGAERPDRERLVGCLARDPAADLRQVHHRRRQRLGRAGAGAEPVTLPRLASPACTGQQAHLLVAKRRSVQSDPSLR